MIHLKIIKHPFEKLYMHLGKLSKELHNSIKIKV